MNEDKSTKDLIFERCVYIEKLINKITQLNENAKYPVDLNDVKKAIYYAKKYHHGQIRQSGEPYYTHPLEVAYMVCDYLFETDAIITSILHDTLEDTDLTYNMLMNLFNNDIAEQVNDLTRIKPTGKISSAELVRRLWVEGKYKLILIKLLDRLHNLETIFAKSPEKQRKIVAETLEYFLAISEILEIPYLTEILYQKCYQTNQKLGFIEKKSLIFDKEIKFSELLISENK